MEKKKEKVNLIASLRHALQTLRFGPAAASLGALALQLQFDGGFAGGGAASGGGASGGRGAGRDGAAAAAAAAQQRRGA